MKLLLGVTGGIAASLIPGWVLYLKQVRGWTVHVILTESATRFVAPAALTAISDNPVYVGNSWMDSGRSVHKELARSADVFAISPCSLNTFARLGAGLADDIVTLTAAFMQSPVVLFPAFSPTEVGTLWGRLSAAVVEAGYHVSAASVPARRTVDGETTATQGFPTIDIFEREILRIVERHATA